MLLWRTSHLHDDATPGEFVDLAEGEFLPVSGYLLFAALVLAGIIVLLISGRLHKRQPIADAIKDMSVIDSVFRLGESGKWEVP